MKMRFKRCYYRSYIRESSFHVLFKKKEIQIRQPRIKNLHSISWSSEIPKCGFYSAVLNYCLLLIISKKINLLNKDTFSIFIFSRIIKDKLMLKRQNCCKTKAETKTFWGAGGVETLPLKCSTKLLGIPICTRHVHSPP